MNKSHISLNVYYRPIESNTDTCKVKLLLKIKAESELQHQAFYHTYPVILQHGVPVANV